MNKIRNLGAVVDLVILKGEVKERDKILGLINSIKEEIKFEITNLGTQRDNIEKANIQLQYLNKIDSLLRDFSVSRKDELADAKGVFVSLFK